MAQGTNMANLIHFQFIHMIIIPYVFIMNTSDNKNQIIEHGWKNVLKNVIGLPNNSVAPHSFKSSDLLENADSPKANNSSKHTDSHLGIQKQHNETSSKKINKITGTSKLQCSKVPNKMCNATLNLHVPFDETPTASTISHASNMNRDAYEKINSSNGTRVGSLNEVKLPNEQMNLQSDEIATLDGNMLARQYNKYSISRN